MSELFFDNSGREYWRTSDGVVYGYVENGKIFLTPEGFNVTTLVHEYTHLWAKAMMEANPIAWKSVKDLLRDTPLWKVVKNDKNYLNIHDNEDLLCSEVLARYSGRNNGAKIRNVFFDRNGNFVENANKDLLERVRRGISKFWNWVGKDLFKIQKFDSVNEITDRVLYDIVNKTRLDIGSQQIELLGQKIKENKEISDDVKINVGRMSPLMKDFIKNVSGVEVCEPDLVFLESYLSKIYKEHINENQFNRKSLNVSDLNQFVSRLSLPDKIAFVDNIEDGSVSIFVMSQVDYHFPGSQYVFEFLLHKESGAFALQDFFKTKESFENELKSIIDDDSKLKITESRPPIMYVQGNDVLELSVATLKEDSSDLKNYLVADILNEVKFNNKTSVEDLPDNLKEIYKKVGANVKVPIHTKKIVTIGDLLERNNLVEQELFGEVRKNFSFEKQMEARIMSLADTHMGNVVNDALEDLKKYKIRFQDFGKGVKDNVVFVNGEVVLNTSLSINSLEKELFNEIERRSFSIENSICRTLINYLTGFIRSGDSQNFKKGVVSIQMAPESKVELLRKLNLPSDALRNEYANCVRIDGQKVYKKLDTKSNKADLIMSESNFIGRKDFCYKYDQNFNILINKVIKEKIDKISGIDSDWYDRLRTKKMFVSCVKSAVITLLKRGEKKEFFLNANNFKKFSDVVADEFGKEWFYQKRIEERKNAIKEGLQSEKSEKIKRPETIITSSESRYTSKEEFDKKGSTINVYGNDDSYGLGNSFVRPFKINLKDCGFTNDQEYKFNCVEQGFQALKVLCAKGRAEVNSEVWKKIFKAKTGAECREVARYIDFSSDGLELWNKNQVKIMQNLVYKSFEQNPKQMEMLFKTGNREFSHEGKQHEKVVTIWTSKFPQILKKVRLDLSKKFPATYIKIQKEISIQNSNVKKI